LEGRLPGGGERKEHQEGRHKHRGQTFHVSPHKERTSRASEARVSNPIPGASGGRAYPPSITVSSAKPPNGWKMSGFDSAPPRPRAATTWRQNRWPPGGRKADLGQPWLSSRTTIRRYSGKP